MMLRVSSPVSLLTSIQLSFINQFVFPWTFKSNCNSDIVAEAAGARAVMQ